MANSVSNKPLQRISWAEKVKDDYAHFKQTADYYIAGSSFGSDNRNRASMQTMYNVYNSQIPLEWFNHITDPLSAKNAAHKAFPAKVRPTNILRTNIDLLLGQWLRRPFNYRVENLGETGYNAFVENLNSNVHQSIQQMFLAMAQEEAKAQGIPDEEISQMTPEQVPHPDEVKKLFHASYKDKQAIRGQKWMKRALIEYNIRRKLHKMFKDWLLVGEAISYKGIHQGNLMYERLSPMYSDYDKSEDNDMIEDGEWFTHQFRYTLSDVVDMFYDELDEAGHKALEAYSGGSTSPTVMFNFLSRIMTSDDGKIPVYLVLWKGKKKILHITYTDPLTGELQEDTIDEAEKKTLKMLGDDVKIVRQEWVNEVYETWRVGDGANGTLYFRMGPVVAQRNAMNNFSVCKLPANGRKYSDTHSDNISVMQIGIPYLIMYMITGRALELTIAKSKGKIMLIDQRAIPEGKGWDEEKFFYYSEALGYGLLNRNQIGVDKSWNQYQVLDMSLYDQIEQLIQLQQHYKQEWDDVVGIPRQMKGQTYASDTNGANERAIFQGSIITDMIFAGFDEFVEKEMQGILDLSKFVNIDGVRKLYNGSDLDDLLLEIDPVEYASAELGIFMTDTPQDHGALDMMKGQVQNFIQNGMKASTVLELFSIGNISEMRAALKQIEAAEAEAAQAQAGSEEEAAAAADERQMRFMEYEKMLEEQLINTEYDRKEDIEKLKGEFNILSYGNPEDADGDGVPDATEVMWRDAEREKEERKSRLEASKMLMQERLEIMKQKLSAIDKDKDRKLQEKLAQDKNNADLRKTKIQAAAARRKATAAKKR